MQVSVIEMGMKTFSQMCSEGLLGKVLGGKDKLGSYCCRSAGAEPPVLRVLGTWMDKPVFLPWRLRVQLENEDGVGTWPEGAPDSTRRVSGGGEWREGSPSWREEGES